MPTLGRQCWVMLDHFKTVFSVLFQTSFQMFSAPAQWGSSWRWPSWRWPSLRRSAPGQRWSVWCVWRNLINENSTWRTPNFSKLSHDAQRRSRNCSRADLDLGQVDPKSLPISSRFHLHHLTSSYIPSGPSPLIKKDLIEATNPNTFFESSRRRRVSYRTIKRYKNRTGDARSH